MATRTVSRNLLRAAQSASKSPLTRSSARFVAPSQVFRQQSHRGYSSAGGAGGAGASSGGSSKAIFLALGLGTIGAGGYYAYSQGLLDSTKNAAPVKEFVPALEDYQKVYLAIAERLIEEDEYDDGSYGPVLVRLAWHASGTYDKDTNTGGSNGATMRFSPEGDHGANAGLKAARDFLEPIKAQFPWITYSDLWTLGGVTAVQEMQGPIVPWRPGRSDRDVSYCTPDGRLPDASKNQDHIRAIFYRMGFDDREIVALSGAHALGRCHTDRSGFDGPWTFSPTTVTNDYYKLLLEEKWAWKKWDGPKQFEDVKSKSLMMLPTDMALIQDKAFKQHVDKYARDNDLFFKDFSEVLVKLFELGVPFTTTEEQRFRLKPRED